MFFAFIYKFLSKSVISKLGITTIKTAAKRRTTQAFGGVARLKGKSFRKITDERIKNTLIDLWNN